MRRGWWLRQSSGMKAVSSMRIIVQNGVEAPARQRGDQTLVEPADRVVAKAGGDEADLDFPALAFALVRRLRLLWSGASSAGA